MPLKFLTYSKSKIHGSQVKLEVKLKIDTIQKADGEMFYPYSCRLPYTIGMQSN